MKSALRDGDLCLTISDEEAPELYALIPESVNSNVTALRAALYAYLAHCNLLPDG